MCQWNAMLFPLWFNQLNYMIYPKIMDKDAGCRSAIAAGGRVKMTRRVNCHYEIEVKRRDIEKRCGRGVPFYLEPNP